MESDAPGPEESRGARRLCLETEANIRRSGTHGFRVRVFDASPVGCKIEFVERPAVGERIWIRFDQLQPIEGTVRWVAGHVGGIEFARPLHEAVFERLAATSRKP